MKTAARRPKNQQQNSFQPSRQHATAAAEPRSRTSTTNPSSSLF